MKKFVFFAILATLLLIAGPSGIEPSAEAQSGCSSYCCGGIWGGGATGCLCFDDVNCTGCLIICPPLY
jgi:hypothetical protein